MDDKFLRKFLCILFLIKIITNTSSTLINQIINFGKRDVDDFVYLNLSNKDLIIISINSDEEYVFSLKEYEKNKFTEENEVIKTLNTDPLEYLNIVNLKINDKEYPLLCSNLDCQIIDYQNNLVYHNSLLNLLNINNNTDNSLLPFLSNNFKYALINLNNENEILFSLIFNETLTLDVIKFFSKDLLSYENKYFYSNNQKLKVAKIEKLSCFMTEKKLIECFYIDSYFYNTAVFSENLTLLEIIEIDNIDKDEDSDNEYISFFNCIHLYKEVGIFTYYNLISEEPILFLQINELIYNGSNYLFNKINEKQKILITLNKTNYLNYFYLTSNENLMKISDNKFSYIFANLDENDNFHIILIIFDLYGNNCENLIAKYYKIDINLFGIEEEGIFLNLNTLMYNSFIGIGFIYYFFSDEFSLPYLILIGNTEQNINELELNITKNYKWKINDDFNITIHNNLFGYELTYKISLISTSLQNLKFYSVNNNSEIKINETINYNDSLSFDYSSANIKFGEEPIIEITAIILEPDYEKALSLCDKVDIIRENQTEYYEYYERKIIDEKKLKVKLNFECYMTCKDCEYVGYNLANQKCLSCKEDNNLCFMQNEGNCYDISTYNYKTYTDSNNNLFCIFDTEGTTNFGENGKTDNKENYALDSNIPNSIYELFDLLYNKIKDGSLDEEIYKNDIILYENNMIIQASTSEKQKYYIDNEINTNLSLIELRECEKKLGFNKPLIILKMDISKNDSFAPQVEYIFINPYTYEIINLSICEGTKINIYVPFNISEENINLYNFVKSQGYNIYNPSDPFFNDICTPFTSYNKTDVLIKDRKKDFYKEYAFCEDICNFDNINLALNKAKCQC